MHIYTTHLRQMLEHWLIPPQPRMKRRGNSHRTATSGGAQHLPVDPKTLDLLVVEDNLINQKVLVSQLRKIGCSVSTANDGLEALAFLRETHFMRLPIRGGRPPPTPLAGEDGEERAESEHVGVVGGC